MSRFCIALIATMFFLFSVALPKTSVSLIYDDVSATEFELQFDKPNVTEAFNGYSRITLAGFGPRGEKFGPELYGRAYNIAVPKGTEISVSFYSERWSDWIDVLPAPAFAVSSDDANTLVNKDLYSYRCGGSASLVADFICRGVRIVAIDIVPVEYDPDRGVRFMKYARVRVEHRGGVGEIYDERLYHPVFALLYRSWLVNPDAAIPPVALSSHSWEPDDGAELLVISHPSFTDELQPWIDWKLLMGMPTIVATTDTIGSDTVSVKAFVQNAYDTWSLPPAYLLIVGDDEFVATYDEWGGMYACCSDNNYCTVDGDDIIPDIFPARLSADYGSELEVMVLKHLNYEKEPDTTDDWYARAVGIVREEDCWPEPGPVDSSYLDAVQYAMDECLSAGFSSAEMFTKCSGHTSTNVRPYMEAGCNFVTFRGQGVVDWWSPFGGLMLEPTGKRLPIFVSITCAMGTFQSDGYPCEYVTRAGTVDEPEGGVAFYGQARISSNSLERSSLSRNIFAGFFEAGLNQIAAAHTYGKNEMLSIFGYTYEALFEYLSSTLIGSPELMAWTAPISVPDVVFPDEIMMGPNRINVVVSASGSALENARVALRQNDSLWYAFTDGAGSTEIDITAEPLVPLVVVVTGANIYPFIDTIGVIPGGVIILSAPTTFIDVIGNNDGVINPGETIAFAPTVTNFGDETSDSGFVCIITQNDPKIQLLDSISILPPIEPGDTISSPDSITFYVSEEHLSTEGIVFTMMILLPDSSDTLMRYVVPNISVERFSATICSVLIDDAIPFGDDDGIVEPGEQINIQIVLQNETNADAYELTGELLGWSQASVVQSMGNYGTLLRDTTASNYPYFSISISHNAPPGIEFPISLALLGNCSTYTYIGTVEVMLEIEGDPMRLPTGPDEYGYYIIDNNDLLDNLVPTYEWEDISEIGTPISDITDSDDEITTIDLPFEFSFYGNTYSSISVASNGFLAPPGCDWSGSGTGIPQAMPTIGGPEGVIALMWSDLAPHRPGGDIYSLYDFEKGQFIIQYDSVEYFYSGGFTTYQVRICDVDAYPTPTGDNEIFCYYRFVESPDNFGVGIESPDESVGVQYALSGSYDETAAEITAGRALRITTNTPLFGNSPWLYFLDSLICDDAGGDGDGIAEPGDEIIMQIQLKNGGNSTALSTEGSIVSTALITATGETAHFGDIAPTETSINYSSPLYFNISTSAPEDTFLMIPVIITANSGEYVDTIGVPFHIGAELTSIRSKKVPSAPFVFNIRPNPFNSRANVDIYVDTKGKSVDCAITIYTIEGRKAEDVFHSPISSGRHHIPISADGLSSGMYLLKVQLDNYCASQKVLLIK